MKPHTIDLDEMLAWIAGENGKTVTYARSGGQKHLEVKLSGGYRVTETDGARVVRTAYEGMDGKSAVDAYNSLP